MPSRKLIVELIGDSRSLERAFGRSSHSAREFEKDIGHSARGVLAATVSMKGLGRSLALGSGAFLGGAGIGFLFRSVISEASRVQEETEKTGVVFGQNAKQVQQWAGTLSQSFGIARGQALESAGIFGNMLRPLGFAEGDAARMSERLVQLAADMASFNNVSPEETLQALSSGLAGQVRPLRQFGIFLSQARIQEEAVSSGIAKHANHLTQAQKVQAAYNIILKDSILQQGDVGRNTESLSVAMSKLHAAVSDLEEGVGKALLPTVTDYVNKAAAWAGDTENQERLIRNLSTTIGRLVHDLEVAADLIDRTARLAHRFTDELGGTEKAIRLVAAAFLGWKLGAIQGGLRGVAAQTKLAGASATVAAAEFTALAGAETAAAGAGLAGAGARFGVQSAGAAEAARAAGGPSAFGIKSVGAAEAARVAGGASLASRLLALGRGGVAALPVGLKALPLEIFALSPNQRQMAEVTIDGRPSQVRFIEPPAPGSLVKIKGTEYVVTYKGNTIDLLSRASLPVTESLRNFTPANEPNPTILAQQQAAQTRTSDDVPRQRAAFTARQRTYFDNAIARILLRGGLGSIRQQIAALDQAEKLIAARIAKTKDVSTKLRYEDQLLQLQAQERGLRQQARADALAKRQKEADARRAREEKHLFQLLGLGPTGEAPTPRVSNLQKRLAQLRENIAGTTFDTPRMTKRLNQIGRALTNALLPKHGEVRQRIAELLDTISGELQKAPKQYTKWGQPSTSALMRGLGLDANQSRILRKRLALLGHGGTTAPGSSAAFAGQTTVVHAHTYIDGREVSKTVTKQQQKDSTRRGQSRRGPYAGRH